MKAKLLGSLILVLVFFSSAQAGFWERLENILKKTTSTQGLSQEELIKGLKEALLVASKRAVSFLGDPENLLQNPDLRIPPPPKVAKVTNFLKKVGFKNQVENFEESLNVAAAAAIQEAFPVFKQGISAITFEDARQLLKGGETAITDYFRQKTSDELYQRFYPLVQKSLKKVGVTRKYQELINNSYAASYLRGTKVDLDHYVTQAALDRLFDTLAQEEIKLRKDPAARTTALLRKLFGSS